jgi:HSP20 family protein
VAELTWHSGEEQSWTFDTLCTELSGLIRDSATPPGPHQALPVDVAETDKTYVIEIELPGIDTNDVRVDVLGNEIRVHGDIPRRDNPGALRYHTRREGHFDNQVALPSEVDALRTSATLRNGVLTVRVPKVADDVSQGAEPVVVPVTGPL